MRIFFFLSHDSVMMVMAVVMTMLMMTQSSYVPEPLCDVHETSRGYPTPEDLLPSPPKSADMLYAKEDDIQQWYDKGYAACEAYRLANQSTLNTEASAHPPFYIDMNRYAGGQKQCRGRATLYDLTGLIVWPFGPYEYGCQTYSKCWFGLLTCGEFKGEKVMSVLAPELERELKHVAPNVTLSLMNTTSLSFSMKSLIVQLRLLGTEIVVPQQILHTVKHSKTGKTADVIIAQYHLTYPSEDYALEARLFEFYPGALLPWKAGDWVKWAYQNIASVFLGGNESRCKPWTKCILTNNCCGCDEKAFVFNTPAQVRVKDGKSRCKSELAKTPSLPLCKVDKHGTNPLGRWIQSSNPSLSPRCYENSSYSIFHMSYHKDTKNPETLRQSGSGAPLSTATWFEASGNPCIHAGKQEKEELGVSHWFFAPYQCKYHFYRRHQLHQCLQDLDIGHIHFQGDSMSRELFSIVSKYLGVPQVTEASLKQMTNDMKMKEIKFHTGSVLLSEGYSWDYNIEILQLSEQPPLPNVIVSNYAFAHRADQLPKAIPTAENTEYRYWTQLRNQQLPKPKYLFFQNARDVHGRRGGSFVGNMMRRFSNYLRGMYGSLGFAELDEFQLTAGRFDTYNRHSDGWHFGGTPRQMEAIVLFNMICNDWLERNGTTSSSKTSTTSTNK